jgi:hypothetical protein
MKKGEILYQRDFGQRMRDSNPRVDKRMALIQRHPRKKASFKCSKGSSPSKTFSCCAAPVPDISPLPPPVQVVQTVVGTKGVTKVAGDCDGLKLKGNTLGAILGVLRLNISFKYEIYKYPARDLRLFDGQPSSSELLISIFEPTSPRH